MKKVIIPAVIIVAVIGTAAVSFVVFRPVPHFNWLDFFIGKVEVIKLDASREPAEVKKRLFADDTVKTWGKSLAYIQCGTDSIIQIFENTELKMNTLPGGPDSADSKTLLDLVKGGASFFIERLTEERTFTLKLQSTTIAVRGTVFYAESRENTVFVAVKEGSVSVTSDTGKFREIVVQPKRKAEIRGSDIQILDLDKDDEKYFKDITELRPIAGIHCAPPDGVEKFFMWRLNLTPAPKKEKEKEKEEKLKPDREKERTDAGDAEKKEYVQKDVKTRLMVSRLIANGIDEATADTISQKLFDGLVSAKGQERVLFWGNADTRSANRVLTGRVSKLGASKIVALNVVDGERGTVLFNKTEVIKEGDSIDAKLGTIVQEIGNMGGIWE